MLLNAFSRIGTISIYCIVIPVTIGLTSCGSQEQQNIANESVNIEECGPTVLTDSTDTFQNYGGLIGTRLQSIEELEKYARIEYDEGVRITQCSNGKTVVSSLIEGISEDDLKEAKNGGFWKRVQLATSYPEVFDYRHDLIRVFVLSRRRHDVYGPGDVAFYDFAESMSDRIIPRDRKRFTDKDLSEKGFLNTFNHINAQAFATCIFSEEFAEYVADLHERHNMPELISGDFTDEQLADPINNPIDNYVDMLNNEWGQEIGKDLRTKYGITRETEWTPTLLSAFLNDLIVHYKWSFGVDIKPFRVSDEIVIRFAEKINQVMTGKKHMQTIR